MRIALTVLTFLCVIVADAARLAPWYSDGDWARDDAAAGIAVGLHGTDAAIAGYYTMVNGVPYDTLTSQGLQAVGVPQDWAYGINAGVSMAGTMGVGAAARGTIGRSISGVDDVLSVSKQATGGSKSVSIQFGGNANQVYHTFRHVDEMGLDRTLVQEAVRKNIGMVSSQIEPGKPFIRVITVGGQKLQYNAYLLPNGTINVGRINGMP